MRPPRQPRPTAEAAARLYLRLLAGEPDASFDLLKAFAQPLINALRLKFPDLPDPAIVDDAVIDTLLEFPKHVARYDPTRVRLWSYLWMDADGNLRNAYQKEKARLARLVPLDVADDLADRNNDLEESVIRRHVPPYLPENVAMEQVRRELGAIRSNSTDWAVLALMLAGVRRTEQYAAVQGISHLPVAEQRRLVKNAKDRVRVRLRRIGAKLDD